MRTLFWDIGNSSGNGTWEFDIATDQNQEPSWVSAFLLPCFIIWGLTGNLLVCVSISIDARLQTVTNFFLLSLAVADLLVCLLVMPLSILTEFNNGLWLRGFNLCLFHVYSDVFLCTASIVHMSVISLERYLGISQPLNLRNKSNWVVLLKILLVWITTTVISSPILVLGLLNPANVYNEAAKRCQIFNSYFMIYGSTLAFLVPLVIMVTTYARTTYLLKKQLVLCQIGDTAEGGLRRTITKNQIKHKKSTLSRGKSRESKDFVPETEQTVDLKMNEQICAENFEEIQTGRNMSVRKQTSTEGCQTIDNQYKAGFPSFSRLRRSTKDTDFSEETEISNFSAVRRPHSLLKSIRSKCKLRTSTIVNFARKTAAAQDVANEQKATRVLGLVFACFFICWTPFFALNFTLAFCKQCRSIPPFLPSVFLWLGFISSTINPVIYTAFNKKFRETFARILRCRCSRRRDFSQRWSTNTNTLNGSMGVCSSKRTSQNRLTNRRISLTGMYRKIGRNNPSTGCAPRSNFEAPLKTTSLIQQLSKVESDNAEVFV